MKVDNRPIGVFDSGVGGLTVAREILANLPDEELVYFGDSGRAPYGPRSRETITAFTLEICDFLRSKDVKALVVACNTICVSCIDLLRDTYDLPVIGVIEPGVRAALAITKGAVGLLATQATVNSAAHGGLTGRCDNSIRFYAKACPLFVPLIEEGFARTPIAYHAALEYLKAFEGKEIDTLILGCTHYPIMKEAIQKAAGEAVTVVDPSYGTAMELKACLEKENKLRQAGLPANHQFYMSGDKETFDSIMKAVFGTAYPSRVHKLG